MRMKMMKRYILLLALLGSTLSLFAQGRLAERCYLMTDRAWYAAGEPVFLSAFCADVSSGVKLSDFSSVAYVELSTAEGVALTGKIALHGGRGAGRLDLPRTLPTGNYRLVAYTASAGNEERYDYTTETSSSRFTSLSRWWVTNSASSPLRGHSKAIRATIRNKKGKDYGSS